MKEASKFVLLPLLTIAVPAFSASVDLTVFDDLLENDFNFCPGITPITYEFDVVHNGTTAMQVPNVEPNGLDFCHNVNFSINDYAGISFWINGGASGGETIQLLISSSDGEDYAYADVASLYGGPLPPNQWVYVESLFSDPLFVTQLGGGSQTVEFSHLIFTDESTSTGYFYFDDVVLKAADIFKNGFECSDPTSPSC